MKVKVCSFIMLALVAALIILPSLLLPSAVEAWLGHSSLETIVFPDLENPMDRDMVTHVVVGGVVLQPRDTTVRAKVTELPEGARVEGVDEVQVNRFIPVYGPFTQTQTLDIPEDGSWLDIPLVDRTAPTDSVVTDVSVKYLLDHPAPSQIEVRLAKVGSEIRQDSPFLGWGCNFSNVAATADRPLAPVADSPSDPAPYAVMLKSGTFIPEPGLEPEVQQRLLDEQTHPTQLDRNEERVHALVQFQKIPSYEQKQALESEGIRLVRYIPDRTWLASFPIQAVDSLATNRAVRWMGEWSYERKVEPALLENRYGSWSYDAKQDLLALIVQFPKDVLLERGRQIVGTHAGSVRQEIKSINSLVVWIKSSDLRSLAEEDEIEWIEQVSPAMSPLNDCVRPRVGADDLQDAPYSLDGSGIDLLVYDSGTVATTHQAFTGRLTIGDTDETGKHATHVAGTAAGDGAGSPGGRNLRGMAPNAGVISYGFEYDDSGIFLYTNPGDIEADWSTAKNTYGADLGTASLGTNTARNGFGCALEGNYGATSHLLDAIVRGSLGEPYIMTWAAGNERGGGQCGTGYNTTAPPAGAKNPIQIGATYSDSDLMTDFSSWGPTDDGRLKPIVSAPGCENSGEYEINSTLPPNDYPPPRHGWCGTSMSAPAVAGIVTLMLQQYRSTYSTSEEFLPSTAKALLIHTAADRGNPGPDYQYGYGRVDGVSAVDALVAGDFREEIVYDNEEEHAFTYSFSGSRPELKVSLAWDDAPAALATTVQLVNNLDLTVVGPDETTYRPYVLNAAQPENTATTGTDNLNNQEQVIVANPAPGTWTVKVRASALNQGPQTYSLVFTGAGNAKVAPDIYEQDNHSSQATPMTVDTSYLHNHHIPDEQDWMKFEALAGHRYTVTTSLLESNADTVLELYDVDGTTLLTENDNYLVDSLASQIIWIIPTNGTYYLRVVPSSNTHAGLHTYYTIDIKEDQFCYTLTISANPSDGGSVNAGLAPPNCAGGKYTRGTVVELTATANTGYSFSNWGEDASGSANPVSVIMNGNKSVTANFILHPEIVSDLTLIVQNNNASLQWLHKDSTVQHYEVYRSTNSPCWNPGTSTCSKLGVDVMSGALNTQMHYLDENSGLGDISINYFYIVLAVNSTGQKSDLSNQVADFDFALMPGSL
ncbi:MAG: S8 family serine peptidase [Chloroflexi bacterium]|nr:S8 family serine peptidase [Chloroflexota bacterium]